MSMIHIEKKAPVTPKFENVRHGVRKPEAAR